MLVQKPVKAVQINQVMLKDKLNAVENRQSSALNADLDTQTPKVYDPKSGFSTPRKKLR